MAAVMLGLALGAGLILYARARGPRMGTIVCAIGLLVAAIIYLGYAGIADA